jgi:hypothetical protein
MRPSTRERLDTFRTKMASVQNLNENKTAGDMKFYIFDYDPKDEIRVREETSKAVRANPEIVLFDLYDMMVEIINNHGYFDTIQQMEQDYDKSLLLEEVFQPLMAFEQSENDMMSLFKNGVPDDGTHIVMITGVGKVYPVIRSHTILNNLHSVFKKNPVVMLYPGTFSVRKGHLKLFDRLDDDNYYRAFPIIDGGEE